MPYNFEIGQRWFIDKMKATGYTKIAEKGQCHGMAYMAMRAFILEDMDTFYERLNFIQGQPPKYFKTIRDDLPRAIETYGTRPFSPTDILAFFDGISLLQSPDSYQAVFGPQKHLFQKLKPAAELTLPGQQAAGGPDVEPMHLQDFDMTHALNQASLEQYLNLLEASFADTGHVSIPLSANGHTILLNYNPVNPSGERWSIVDTNALSTTGSTDLSSEACAGAIFNAFSALEETALTPETPLIIDFSFYTQNPPSQALSDGFIALEKSRKLAKIYRDVTDKNKLLLEAAKNGRLSTLRDLIAEGADPRFQNSKKESALTEALFFNQVEVVDFLLKEGIFSVNTTVHILEEFQEPLLHRAAFLGHIELVELLLLQHGATIDRTNQNGRTALFVAADMGHANIVALLLMRGANPAVLQDISLHNTASKGYTDMIPVLVQAGLNPNAKDRAQNTPLHLAASSQHTETIRTLLQQGATDSVKATNAQGITPLMMATRDKRTANIRLLLQYGAIENLDDLLNLLSELNEAQCNYFLDIFGTNQLQSLIGDPSGLDNALMAKGDPGYRLKALLTHLSTPYLKRKIQNPMILSGFLDIMQIPSIAPYFLTDAHIGTINYLIQQGADKYQLDDAGHTILYVAAVNGQYRLVDEFFKDEMLLEKTKATLQDYDTLMQFLKKLNEVQCNHFLDILGTEALEALIDDSKLPRLAEEIGQTKEYTLKSILSHFPKHYLRRSRSLPDDEYKRLGDVQDKDSMLYEAAKEGSLEAVQACITDGADVNHLGMLNKTALHAAAANGHFEIVNLLLTNGAKPHEHQKAAGTPIALAQQNGHTKIVDLLVQYGAPPPQTKTTHDYKAQLKAVKDQGHSLPTPDDEGMDGPKAGP